MYRNSIVECIAIAQDVEPAQVQLKAGIKRKRPSQDGNTNIHWTASRCHRLLRTITSRINILQKAYATNRGIDRSSKTAASEDRHERILPPRPSCVATTSNKDPEWLPHTKHQLKTATYTGKTGLGKSAASGKHQSCPRTSELDFPTPFARRILRTETSSGSSDSEGAQVRKLPLPGKRKHVRVPVKPTSTIEEAHRNLVAAFDSLLRVTQAPVPRASVGTRSLMKACLRKVPDYIDLEDSADTSDTEDGGVSFELYSDLECLGTNSATGWSNLREVVRAHGVQKICSAVREAFISESVLRALVDVCADTKSAEEGHIILTAWAKGSSNAARALSLHSHFSREYGTESAFIQSVAALLRSGRLSPQDVDAEHSVWSEVMAALVRPGAQSAGIRFLESYLEACGRQTPSLPASQVFQSFVTVLAVMALTETEAVSDPRSARQSIAHVVHSVATHIGLVPNTEVGCAGKLFMTGSLILSICSFHQDTEYVSLGIAHLVNNIGALHTKSDDGVKMKQPSAAAIFLRNIGSRVGVLDRESGDALFEHMVRSTVEASAALSVHTMGFLKTLARDSALAYADQHNTKRSLAFVEEVEEMTLHIATSGISKTPNRQANSKLDRYRWEEGLCEWVAGTPSSSSAIHSLKGNVFDESIPGLKQTQDMLRDGGGHGSLEETKDREELETTQSSQTGAKLTTPSTAMDPGQESLSPESFEDLDELALFSSAKKATIEPECPRRDTKSNMRPLTDFFHPGIRKKALERSTAYSRMCQDVETSDDELGM